MPADGKVNMISHDFISLLMLGLFNVSIGRQQIRADLNYEALVSNSCLHAVLHRPAPKYGELSSLELNVSPRTVHAHVLMKNLLTALALQSCEMLLL